MNYALSTARCLWKTTVAVPKLIFDKHLKFASARQLKVLLFMLAGEADSYTSVELAQFLCCTSEELEDCMEYWFACGVVSRDQTENAVQQLPTITVKEDAPVVQPKLQVKLQSPTPELPVPTVTKVLDVPRLSPRDVISRGNEDPKIASLLQETQSVLCRSISHSEQEMLINMVDYYGLKPEVILMILAYTKKVDKANTRYILSIAKNWGDEGIDTMERAEEKLEEIALCDEKWKTICTIAEMPKKSPSPKQREFTLQWLTTWHFSAEMIGHAFEIAKDNEIKKTFPYVNKILATWFEKNIKTLSELAKSETEHDKGIKSGRAPAPYRSEKGKITSAPSYDINEIEQSLLQETLHFGG